MEAREFFRPLNTWGPATLVSLLLHGLALYGILMLPPLKTPVKRVVEVETIMTAIIPKPAGGGGGGGSVAAAPPALEPAKPVPPPPKPKPSVAPKPKPMVKSPPVPACRPDPIPPPPPLAMPRPAAPVVPPRLAPPSSVASSSSISGSGSRLSVGQGGSGAGSGIGTGSGSGSGSGRGSGSGGGSGSGHGTGSGSALQGYLHQVRSLLERNKIYPPQARSRNEQGTVVVRFTISSDGSIGGVSLSSPSGQSTLDQAALETVNRVRRFPPFPGDLQRSSLTVQVPLAYRLNGG